MPCKPRGAPDLCLTSVAAVAELIFEKRSRAMQVLKGAPMPWSGLLLSYAVSIGVLLYTTVWSTMGMLVGLFFCFGSKILFAHLVCTAPQLSIFANTAGLRMGTIVFNHLAYFFEKWGGIEIILSGMPLNGL